MSPFLRTVLALTGGLVAVIGLYLLVGVLGVSFGLAGIMLVLIIVRRGDLFNVGQLTRTSTNDRIDARRERFEAAQRIASLKQTKQNLDAGDDAFAPAKDQEVSQEPLTDYWKLPKTGARTTLLNSAWTWTLVTYVAIMAIVVLSVAQSGLGFIDAHSHTARMAIAAGLLYPAWRIGSLISRFLKKRGLGTGFSVKEAVGGLVTGTAKPKKAARPGSVEARMAARRVRLEKARREGKL